jgi:predicted nucleotidyltransferase
MTGMQPLVEQELSRLRQAAAAADGLSLLVLHGSRARGTARPDSDWDFAYLADPGFDPDALLAGLAEATHAERIDLADLARAGALLRVRVADAAVVIVERDAGTFDRFWFDAVHAWCDLEPVLTPAYQAILDGLPR